MKQHKKFMQTKKYENYPYIGKHQRLQDPSPFPFEKPINMILLISVVNGNKLQKQRLQFRDCRDYLVYYQVFC